MVPRDTVFEEFVRSETTSLLRFAYLLCNDARLAEDLVRDALLATDRHFAKLANPAAHVRRSIVNRYVSWRRLPRNREVPWSSLDLEGSALDAIAAADERTLMWHALRSLPPQQRAVLVLRYYEGLDDGGIAAILGYAESTVRSYASRALGALHEVPGLAVRRRT